MPTRNAYKKVVTSDLQGDDSYVVYRPLTVKEARDLQKEVSTHQQEINKIIANGANELGVEISKLTDEQRNEILAKSGYDLEALAFVDKQYAKLIIDWNWVDFDDSPLPKPKDDYNVLAQLTTDEYAFIAGLFSTEQVNEKN